MRARFELLCPKCGCHVEAILAYSQRSYSCASCGEWAPMEDAVKRRVSRAKKTPQLPPKKGGAE